jgi:hypothetical protein
VVGVVVVLALRAIATVCAAGVIVHEGGIVSVPSDGVGNVVGELACGTVVALDVGICEVSVLADRARLAGFLVVSYGVVAGRARFAHVLWVHW